MTELTLTYLNYILKFIGVVYSDAEILFLMNMETLTLHKY